MKKPNIRRAKPTHCRRCQRLRLERALSIIENLPYPQDYAAKDLRAALTKAGYTF